MAHAKVFLQIRKNFTLASKNFILFVFTLYMYTCFYFVCVQCSSAVGGYLGLIGDVCWVERLANMVTSHMLAICPTPFEREHLLRLLHDGTFGQGFQSSGQYS